LPVIAGSTQSLYTSRRVDGTERDVADVRSVPACFRDGHTRHDVKALYRFVELSVSDDVVCGRCIG